MSKDLNRLMAEEVMGWKQMDEADDYYTVMTIVPHYKTLWDTVPFADWNPCENIEQAFMCVEKMPHSFFALELHRSEDRKSYVWMARLGGLTFFPQGHDNPAQAIVEAIAQVKNV